VRRRNGSPGAGRHSTEALAQREAAKAQAEEISRAWAELWAAVPDHLCDPAWYEACRRSAEAEEGGFAATLNQFRVDIIGGVWPPPGSTPQQVPPDNRWIFDDGRFRCPVCLRTSASPDDAEHGYCGACHWFTGKLSARAAVFALNLVTLAGMSVPDAVELAHAALPPTRMHP
jgi:hypothetical protein